MNSLAPTRVVTRDPHFLSQIEGYRGVEVTRMPPYTEALRQEMRMNSPNPEFRLEDFNKAFNPDILEKARYGTVTIGVRISRDYGEPYIQAIGSGFIVKGRDLNPRLKSPLRLGRKAP